VRRWYSPVEVTLTVPGAVEVIRELTRHHSGLIVGAGSVFHVETAKRCLDAGALFLTNAWSRSGYRELRDRP
jgi:2-dehydro-3-deoxyphosphogluconate aldolase / (4S)-4-hydroxy-2-oxoglutarate aldolase